VRGAEEAAAGLLRDRLERRLVDVDLHRPVDGVAEEVLHRKRRHAARAGPNGVDLDAQRSGRLGGGLRWDVAGVVLSVGGQDEELAQRGRLAEPAVSGVMLRALFGRAVSRPMNLLGGGAARSRLAAAASAEPMAVPSSIIPTLARARFWSSQPWSSVSGAWV